MASILEYLPNIARSVKAAGISGALATGLVYLAQSQGITVSPELAAQIVGVVMVLAAHLVPDSAKQQVDALAARLDISAKDLAALVPQIYEIYPAGKNGASGS